MDRCHHPEAVKLVIVGDGGVGKSSLLITYTTDRFPSEYVPTVFDNYSVNMTVDEKCYTIGFWDTAGQEDYDRLRPLAYPQTDIFLVAFSIENRTSFENVASKWLPELQHHCGDLNTSCITVLVGCKGDLRKGTHESLVTQEEARKYAKSMNILYFETSSLTQTGMSDLFQNVIHLHSRLEQRKKKTKGFSFGLSKKKHQQPILFPPVMPPAGKAPWIEIETSAFGDHWLRLLQDPQHADVRFVVEGGRHNLQAHTVLLASASAFFQCVFGVLEDTTKNQLKAIKNAETFDVSELRKGLVPGIAGVIEEHDEETGRDITVVELSQDIQAKHFVHILEFLYSGLPCLSDNPSEEELDNLINLSRIFHLPYLETVCENIRSDQDFLNPSIGTFLCDETGKQLKEMFMNKKQLSDVVFKVEGTRVPAHKVVVSARSEMLHAMLSGHFVEGSKANSEVTLLDTPLDAFLAVLEYLYTDHAPIEEGDPASIMVIADRFVQPRLVNLCELYATKEVDRHCTKNIEKSSVDVIGLMAMSEMHNASQLVDWCLHFISTNYTAFKQRPEFANLQGRHLEYVQEHQWPPVSYLEEVAEYEEKCKSSNIKADACDIM